MNFQKPHQWESELMAYANRYLWTIESNTVTCAKIWEDLESSQSQETAYYALNYAKSKNTGLCRDMNYINSYWALVWVLGSDNLGM